MENIKKILESQISLVLIPKSNYNEILLQVLSFISKHYKAVCYITLNKPYNTILTYLNKNKIKSNIFFFVDAVSGKKKGEHNCIFVSSPSVLSELGIAFSKSINHCENTLLDSISTLFLYDSGKSAAQFLHSLITKSRNTAV